MQKMETIRQTEKKYCSRALAITIILSIFFIAGEQIAIGKGLILGCLFSILNFVLMGETLPYRIGKTKKRTLFISLGSIYFRYIILAIPLVVSAKLDTFNLFSVIAGIFAVQIVLFVDHVYIFLASMGRKKNLGNDYHARIR